MLTFNIESRKRPFKRCSCEHWAGRLIAQGYFPVGPGDVLTAVSFDVLDAFQCFSTNGAFSKEGFAKGLEEFHFLRLRQEPRNYIEHFRLCLPFWLRTRRKRDSLVNKSLNELIERLERGQEEVRIENEKDEGVADTDSTTAPGRPIRFKTGSLVDLCPACFYRLSDRPEDSSPTIVCADGNFQQNRLKHVGYKNLDEYETDLFLHMTKEERASVDNSLPQPTGDCSHHFKASTKPYTMRHYDETGLISLVCRYNDPVLHLLLQ